MLKEADEINLSYILFNPMYPMLSFHQVMSIQIIKIFYILFS